MIQNELKNIQIPFFCILDKNYLLFGLALYESLKEHGGNFSLHILCMDQESIALVDGYKSYKKIDNLHTIHVDEVKSAFKDFPFGQMSYAQTCWSMQPLGCLYFLSVLNFSHIIYQEADSYFYSDYWPILQEMGTGECSIVPHRYISGYDQTATSGTYCVQFNCFKNTPENLKLLSYWAECCGQYHVNRPSSFPGQLSLDHWPSKFHKVKSIDHIGAGAAPWNITNYHVSLDTNLKKVFLDDKELIFYHFHLLSFVESDYGVDLGDYPLSDQIIQWIYIPYLKRLLEIRKTLQTLFPDFNSQKERTLPPDLLKAVFSFDLKILRKYLGGIRRKSRGVYHIYRWKDLEHQTGEKLWNG